MTVKMSSEGDSSKNSLAEGNDKKEGEAKEEQKQDKQEQPAVKKTDNKAEESAASEEAATTTTTSKSDGVDDKDGGDKAKAASDETVEKNSDGASAEKKDDKKKEEVKKDVKKGAKKDAKKKDESDEEEGSDGKEEEESEGKDDDEGGEDENGDDKEVPLLDQPLEKSGKRERKNVQRFSEGSPKEPTKTEIPEGKGTTLGNIPRIDASISRFKNDDMKLLHKILFKTPGKSSMVKKNIKKFAGFEFDKESEEYTKKMAFVCKCDLKHLKSICEMLDLAKSGTKDEIADRIMGFLLEPKDSGKPVGGGRPKRTAAVRANNRGYSSHDNYSSDEQVGGRSTRDKGKRPNLKEDSSSHSDEDFEPSDASDDKPRVAAKRKRTERKKKADSDDEEEMSDLTPSSDEDSDFQDEPKGKRKKVTPKTNNKAKGKTAGGGGKRGRKPGSGKKAAPATPSAKPAPKKRGKVSSDEEEEEEESEHKKSEDGSSSEDEPLVKKTKTAQPPTDEEIKTYVKEILEGANLEQITMKNVCQQVYAHYPDFDLAHKKDFIKSTVKSLIAT